MNTKSFNIFPWLASLGVAWFTRLCLQCHLRRRIKLDADDVRRKISESQLGLKDAAFNRHGGIGGAL
jgi:hypothetical protein